MSSQYHKKIEERFKRILETKLGVMVTSDYDSNSPERQLRNGHKYEIVGKSKIIYNDGRICNIFVRIQDERGKKVYVPYINFRELV